MEDPPHPQFLTEFDGRALICPLALLCSLIEEMRRPVSVQRPVPGSCRDVLRPTRFWRAALLGAPVYPTAFTSRLSADGTVVPPQDGPPTGERSTALRKEEDPNPGTGNQLLGDVVPVEGLVCSRLLGRISAAGWKTLAVRRSSLGSDLRFFRNPHAMRLRSTGEEDSDPWNQVLHSTQKPNLPESKSSVVIVDTTKPF